MPLEDLLDLTCDLYAFAPIQDADAGYDPGGAGAFPLSAAGVPCAIQYEDTVETEANGRLGTANVYSVYFDANPALPVRSKVVWTDFGGDTHTAFVTGKGDEAGKGVLWRVPVQETL